MILNILNFKQQIYTSPILSKYTVISLLLSIKSIINCYLKLITILLQNNLLIINTNILYSKIILDFYYLTKIPTINFNNWIFGFLSNWNNIKKNILLYRWIYKILSLCYKKILILDICYIKILYTLFYKLYFKYHTLLNIYILPKYFFIINSINDNYIIKESLLLKKYIIYSTLNKTLLYNIIPLQLEFNTKTLYLFLKLILFIKIQFSIF